MIEIDKELKTTLDISYIEFSETSSEDTITLSSEIEEGGFVGDSLPVVDVIKGNALGRIDLAILNNPEARVIFKRSLGEAFSLQFNHNFSKTLEKAFSSKVTDPQSMGHYSDIIEEQSIAYKFKTYGLRTAMANLSTLIIRWFNEGKLSTPVELDYGFSETSFLVQMIIPVFNFEKNDLMVALGSNRYYPFVSTLEGADYSDLFYFEKGEKLVITMLWSKSSPEFSSFQIRGLGEFLEFDEKERSITAKIKLKKEYESLEKLPKTSDFKNPVIESIENPVLVYKIVNYIQKTAPKEELDMLSANEKDMLIGEYPIKKELLSISIQDRRHIVQILGDSDLKEALAEYVKTILGSLDDGQFVESIGNEVEEMEDDLTIVKGTREEAAELWRVKRLEVVEKVHGILNDKRGMIGKEGEVVGDIESTLRESLELNEDEVTDLLTSLRERAANDLISPNGKESEIRSRLEIEKLKNSNQMRGEQLKRLKRLLDSMRDELASRGNVSEIVGDIETADVDKLRDQALSLRDELVKSTREISDKEKQLQELKEMYDGEVAEKDAEIKGLSEHLSRLINSYEPHEDAGAEVVSSNHKSDKGEQIESSEKISELENNIIEFKMKIAELEANLQSAETKKEDPEKKKLANQVQVLEQKNKIIQMKLEEEKSANESKADKPNAALEKKTRQLELLNHKLESKAKKYKRELAEKKTEAHKAQLENKTMKNKIHQLERQVANLSKRKIA